MSDRSRGSRQGRIPYPRRQTSWANGTGGTAAVDISAGTAVFLGSAIQAAVDGLTVIRTRGLFRTYLTLGTNVGDGFQGAFGIGIASLAAVTAGIGSVPTPITEQEADSWLFWMPVSIHAPVATATELSAASSQDILVDSKAMRKLETTMAIYAIFEAAEVGVATATLYWDSRSLVKLP